MALSYIVAQLQRDLSERLNNQHNAAIHDCGDASDDDVGERDGFSEEELDRLDYVTHGLYGQ